MQNGMEHVNVHEAHPNATDYPIEFFPGRDLPLPEIREMRTFEIAKGMAKSIFENKYSRRKEDGSFQNWEERVSEVVDGNFSLLYDDFKDLSDYERTLELAVAGVMPFSGRHLQHGDMNQKFKLGETYTNCASASFSFVKFWLLLKGAGVGRCYDADVCRVNWDNMPETRFVLESPDNQGAGGHPDYESWVESKRSAMHKYDSESEDVRWFTVADSAEGWVKVVEILETAAFQEKHKHKLFIFDFSKIRSKGTPIKGQQGRPASGPIPFMLALKRVTELRGAGMKPWLQALFVDHYLSSCVCLGGIRRSSRIAVKNWRERDIFDFIDIKRGGWLYTANNSIGVDAEFWEKSASPAPSHARRVFEAICSAAYFDKTGEPGLINLDKLSWNGENMGEINSENYMNSSLMEDMELHPKTLEMIDKVLGITRKKLYPYIVNPCVPADTWIMTEEGPRQVKDLINNPFSAVVDGAPYASEGFFKTGYKDVYRVITSRGYEFRATANHQVKVVDTEGNMEWVEVQNLVTDDAIVLHNHSELEGWPGKGSFEEGWLVGYIVGNGCFNPEKYPTYLGFWETSQKYMANKAQGYIRKVVEGDRGLTLKADFGRGKKEPDKNGRLTVQTRHLDNICAEYITEGDKRLKPEVELTSSEFHRGFVGGFFDADGSVQGNLKKGVSICLSQNNLDRLYVVQRMLARLGVISTLYKYRAEADFRLIPDGRGGHKEYYVEAVHELMISRDNIDRFRRIGFQKPDKQDCFESIFAQRKRRAYREFWSTSVIKVVPDGREAVYDCSVDGVHEFDGNGMSLHNCGETILFLGGAYCVIGDICLANAFTKQEVLDAAGLMTKALIRVNTMSFLYDTEVKRTNRIGVGLTGIFEFAYKHFGYNFFDLIDESKSQDFWDFIESMRKRVADDSRKYSRELGLAPPHTTTLIKPSGTIGKVMSCTEGAHLSAYAYYTRWVQYPKNDPEVEAHRKRGYPVKDVSHQYTGHVVVGFPTKMPIADLMGDSVVVMGDTTSEQQYRWLQLLEKYWLGEGENQQISYTLKYDPKKMDYLKYMATILEYQKSIRCCAVMPQLDLSAYAYLPEESTTKEEYEELVSRIKRYEYEDYDDDTLQCAGGSCPIEPNINGHGKGNGRKKRANEDVWLNVQLVETPV